MIQYNIHYIESVVDSFSSINSFIKSLYMCFLVNLDFSRLFKDQHLSIKIVMRFLTTDGIPPATDVDSRS